ncbi:hypothetical protein L1987_53355 [Smallanthus sonchifolius]|uniref:Uncharacterized protein n=1 Tax=Smallanthus sonchifolius TaxID=185202 RepID=A0ACB9EWA9_9ASTR|nr:hypothetical protein L1987_53355 [Smallanthus sonchifolius]
MVSMTRTKQGKVTRLMKKSKNQTNSSKLDDDDDDDDDVCTVVGHVVDRSASFIGSRSSREYGWSDSRDYTRSWGAKARLCLGFWLGAVVQGVDATVPRVCKLGTTVPGMGTIVPPSQKP